MLPHYATQQHTTEHNMPATTPHNTTPLHHTPAGSQLKWHGKSTALQLQQRHHRTAPCSAAHPAPHSHAKRVTRHTRCHTTQHRTPHYTTQHTPKPHNTTHLHTGRQPAQMARAEHRIAAAAAAPPHRTAAHSHSKRVTRHMRTHRSSPPETQNITTHGAAHARVPTAIARPRPLHNCAEQHNMHDARLGAGQAEDKPKTNSKQAQNEPRINYTKRNRRARRLTTQRSTTLHNTTYHQPRQLTPHPYTTHLLAASSNATGTAPHSSHSSGTTARRHAAPPIQHRTSTHSVGHDMRTHSTSLPETQNITTHGATHECVPTAIAILLPYATVQSNMCRHAWLGIRIRAACLPRSAGGLPPQLSACLPRSAGGLPPQLSPWPE